MRVWRIPALMALTALLAGCVSGRTPEAVPAAGTFVSEIGGFRYTLPASWRGHACHVHELAGADAAAAFYQAEYIADISYFPEDTAFPPQVMVGFLILKRADYDTIMAEEGPPPGDLLAEREGKVYLLGLPQSNPYPPGSKDARNFDQMNQTLEQVKQSFSLL